MVGYGADAQGALFEIGGVGVERGGLHLDREHAHVAPFAVPVAAGGGVEVVRGEDVADLHVHAVLLRAFNGLGKQRVVRDGGEGPVELEIVDIAGVGARALTGDDVHELQLVLKRPGGADADDVVHAVLAEKLPAVDADGGHTHAGGHDRHGNALPRAGVPLHAADVVDEHGVCEEGVGDELRAQRVAGHEHGLGDLAGLCVYMGSGNRHR